MKQAFDVVGDVHGYAEPLEQLLLAMGYEKKGKGFQHPDRTLIFIGDLVDRGPDQQRTVEIARSMVDYGDAIVLMGNHEFNAICYAMPQADSSFIRPHNDKNFLQHKDFLKAFPFGSNDYRDAIAFFKRLPLWLEDDEFRAIHACWHEPSLATLRPVLDDQYCIQDDSFYERFSDSESDIYKAVEVILKGPEVSLPDGVSFKDSDGNERHEARVHWWHLPHAPEKAFLGVKSVDQLLDGAATYIYDDQAKPVMFGHYSKVGENVHEQSSSDCAFCLDWGVIRKRKQLCALRWNGNLKDSERFVIRNEWSVSRDV